MIKQIFIILWSLGLTEAKKHGVKYYKPEKPTGLCSPSKKCENSNFALTRRGDEIVTPLVERCAGLLKKKKPCRGSRCMLSPNQWFKRGYAFEEPMPIPRNMQKCGVDKDGRNFYRVKATELSHWFGLRDHNGNKVITREVWGYGEDCEGDNPAPTHPGPTFETYSFETTRVLWSTTFSQKKKHPLFYSNEENVLCYNHPLHCGLHAHGCKPEVRVVMHVHGGHTDPDYDGHPEKWFTAESPITQHYAEDFNNNYGTAFLTRDYLYHMDQKEATLWYHDHGLGITRLNVWMGLAGFWILRGPTEQKWNFPSALNKCCDNELLMVFQDKDFEEDTGDIYYPGNPIEEARGKWILTNGMAWPKVDVKPQVYRIRWLGGMDSVYFQFYFTSDKLCPPKLNFRRGEFGEEREMAEARSRAKAEEEEEEDTEEEEEEKEEDEAAKLYGKHSLRWKHLNRGKKHKYQYYHKKLPKHCYPEHAIPFTIIGSDVGLYPKPVRATTVVFGSAERIELLIDFGDFAGESITLRNVGPPHFEGPRAPGYPASFDVPRFGEPYNHIARFKVGRVDEDDSKCSFKMKDIPAHIEEFRSVPDKDVYRSRQIVMAEIEDKHEYLICPNQAPFQIHQAENKGCKTFMEPITEFIDQYTCEEWQVFTVTPDAHQLHLHQIEFEVVGRRNILDENGEPAAIFNNWTWGTQPKLGPLIPPYNTERGPKDTVQTYNGQVTIIRGCFDLSGRYVYHCHILSHEDKDMMSQWLGTPHRCDDHPPRDDPFDYFKDKDCPPKWVHKKKEDRDHKKAYPGVKNAQCFAKAYNGDSDEIISQKPFQFGKSKRSPIRNAGKLGHQIRSGYRESSESVVKIVEGGSKDDYGHDKNYDHGGYYKDYGYHKGYKKVKEFNDDKFLNYKKSTGDGYGDKDRGAWDYFNDHEIFRTHGDDKKTDYSNVNDDKKDNHGDNGLWEQWKP